MVDTHFTVHSEGHGTFAATLVEHATRLHSSHVESIFFANIPCIFDVV
jgi:hypothetical protein